MRYPDVIIFGAAKGGTTSLYHYLNQHPHVFMSPVKETNFFASLVGGDPYQRDSVKIPIRTHETYLGLFKDATGQAILGEASPLYLEHAGVPAVIRRWAPDAKLIAILREPVSRAVSSYAMRTRKGYEHRPIDEAIVPNSHYMQIGLYAKQLRPYFAQFPAEQLKIFLYNDLREDTNAVVREVFNFIGVEPAVKIDTETKHNTGGYPRSALVNRVLGNAQVREALMLYVPKAVRAPVKRLWAMNLGKTPELSHEARANLKAFVRDDVLALQLMLGRDLSKWLH